MKGLIRTVLLSLAITPSTAMQVVDIPTLSPTVIGKPVEIGPHTCFHSEDLIFITPQHQATEILWLKFLHDDNRLDKIKLPFVEIIAYDHKGNIIDTLTKYLRPTPHPQSVLFPAHWQKSIPWTVEIKYFDTDPTDKSCLQDVRFDANI